MMATAPPLPPELSRSVSALARALATAARTWAMYPREHPAVRAASHRCSAAFAAACAGRPLVLGITPDSILVQDGVLGHNPGETPIAEAAGWLHQRDLAGITLRPEADLAAVEALLALLAEDPAAVRARGGPAAAWELLGHAGIGLDQIDFTSVMNDAPADHPARAKDDLWRSLVRAVLDRRRSLDEASQQRLLDIACDILAIGELAQDVMAPNCTPDGSPLLTSQASAVMAAYGHLVGVADVMAPERRAEVLRNLASATASLDPHVVMQMFSAAADAAPGAGGAPALRRAVADAMDDTQVAQLLAATVALDGRATGRLASAFGTIAPDGDRRRRVLGMARAILSDSPAGRPVNFETVWATVEELLLTYNERPFVSAQYRQELDAVGGRSDAMAADVPPELSALVATLHEDNVRRLSVVLLQDLLAMEQQAGRAAELTRDLAALGEGFLLAGDHGGARDVVVALAARAADRGSVASTGARVALDALVNTAVFHEAVRDLTDLPAPAAALLAELCETVGPAAAPALLAMLDAEPMTAGAERARGILAGYGSAVVSRTVPLLTSPHWYARRNAAVLLGEIGSPEAVPLLQPLLRGGDPRVTQAAIRALSNIDDPSAARSVHTALRAASGSTRQALIAALVAERDSRVVPLLARILDESDAVGRDHEVVLEALGAVGTLGGDAAVSSVDRVMRRTRWFARPRLRAVKTASVKALRQIGTPAAAAALSRAVADGDRLLRRVAADGGGTR